MKYRQLGKTGMYVSEIALGAEWMERRPREEVTAVIRTCEEVGINFLDCWMCEPEVRSNLGHAIAGHREQWMIQGHIGSTWQNGQYMRTRDLQYVKPAFEDLLTRFQTDYMDIGVIHFVDEVKEFESLMSGAFLDYVRQLKAEGTIRAVGMSTHNPIVAQMAARSGEIDSIMISINPAFDMRPPSENIEDMFSAAYEEERIGIAPERQELYKLCETRGVGLTVMKGYAGGRLFDASRSPFGVAMTPVQCLHYALTRPAVAAVMVGVENPEHVRAAAAYETATDAEKDYATVLANAPHHAYSGQCTYCGHCAPCPKKIDIAMVNKLMDLAAMSGEPTDTVRSHYEALSATADDCIGCGGCETRCPFGVKVVERMKQAQKVFSK